MFIYKYYANKINYLILTKPDH